MGNKIARRMRSQAGLLQLSGQGQWVVGTMGKQVVTVQQQWAGLGARRCIEGARKAD